MSLLDLIGRSYENIGQAKAEAAQRVGQIWATAAQSLGQLPEQIQAQKAAQLQNQVTTAQLQGLQAAQASQQRASQALQGIPRNPDGTFDIGQLDDALAKANVLPEDHERLLTSFGKVNDTIKSWRQAQLDHTASIADSILSAHGPNDPVTWDAVNQGLAQAKVMGLATDAEAQQFAQLQASGADPVQVLKTIRSQGSKFSGPTKYTPLPADSGGVLNEATGQVTPTGVSAVPKTEAELAADAANPDSPTALRSASALKLLHGAKPIDEWGSFQQATAQKITGRSDATFQDLTPEQQLEAVKQFKTINTDVATAAAIDRQTRQIQAQISAANTHETNQQANLGRAELDKAEDALGKAQAQAQTFRDVVAAAKSGNKYAASQQALEGALTTIRDAGLSRINQTEIGASAGAGSLWDKIQGWVGKQATGQPIPPDIQDAMLQYANILEKGAYQAYSDKFDQTTKRYPLPNEVKKPAPTGGVAAPRTGKLGAQTVTDGQTITQNGKAYTVHVDAQGNVTVK